MHNLVEYVGFETGLPPKDITGTAQTGDWISLRDFSHVTILLVQGAWADGTAAVVLKQAKDVSGDDGASGSSGKALALTTMWTKVGLTGDDFVKTAVTSNTFDLPDVANTISVIEIEANELDTDNDFTCVRVNVASPGSHADLLTIVYVLSGTRYPQAAMSDAKVDA